MSDQVSDSAADVGAVRGQSVVWVYEQLRDSLVHDSLDRGVLFETELASRFGVSRTPVREALSLLESDGFLERAVRGYRVRRVDAATLVGMHEARAALEVAIAGAAAERRTALELALLERLHTVTLESEDVEELDRARVKFHQTLWESGHNPSITALLERLFLQIRILDQRKSTDTEDIEAARRDHGAILDAVRSGDAAAAKQAMMNHAETAAARLLEQLAIEEMRGA